MDLEKFGEELETRAMAVEREAAVVWREPCNIWDSFPFVSGAHSAQVSVAKFGIAGHRKGKQ